MEIYKNILGFEGLYQISNLGNVKSLGGSTTKILNQGEVNFIKKDKILSVRKVGGGKRNTNYNQVVLYDKNSKRHNKYVHRLVAETFIGIIPENYVVNHKDFNGLNNNVDNLEIMTQRENTIHYQSYNNELYNKELLIDLHHNKKMTLREIGRYFNKSHSQIKRLLLYYDIEIFKYKINQFT